MNKYIFEKHIVKMLDLYDSSYKEKLYKLKEWIDDISEEREVLDTFLDNIKFIRNRENRLMAFSRIVELKETGLKVLIEKEELSNEKAQDILDKAYNFTKDYHKKLQKDFIEQIKKDKLLTPFYQELLSWIYNVWQAFSDFYLVWNKQILKINNELDKKFHNNKELIMEFLTNNNLIDLWYDSKPWDRSYSVLTKNKDSYISKPYKKAFPNEVWNIIKELEIFINNLSKLEDNIYSQKENYISYLKAIKKAFWEDNKDNLISKWAKVDKRWMDITTPFQITHPLEFYEDKFRKAVAPEWDLRIKTDFISNSSVLTDIIKMHEWFYKSIWKEDFLESYNFSLDNLKKIQLYISIPVLYFWSNLCWLPSAQVVPNDEIVSKRYWKKIFAFPKSVLEFQRNTPFLKIQSMTINKNLLNKYRKFLYWDDDSYYKVYDIETLWHEFGHLLFLTEDTENKMNKKTGLFKNIEEFKATSWWLISFFLADKEDNLKEKLVINHIIRCINLLKYKKEVSVTPYYCEALIHLELLIKSWIIYIKRDKIYMYFNQTNYKDLKKIYIEVYSKLVYIYLNKQDAGDFLFDYLIHHNDSYKSKNKDLQEFADYYYELYKEVWNEIDDKVKKEDYLKQKKEKSLFKKIKTKILKWKKD